MGPFALWELKDSGVCCQCIGNSTHSAWHPSQGRQKYLRKLCLQRVASIMSKASALDKAPLPGGAGLHDSACLTPLAGQVLASVL